jgi:hypothetical protein
MAGTFTRLINGVARTIQIDQEVTLASGITTKVVTFPLTLQTGNASPRVVAWMFDSTDTLIQFQPVTITARSSTGFTATWSGATSSSNYILGYFVADGWMA